MHNALIHMTSAVIVSIFYFKKKFRFDRALSRYDMKGCMPILRFRRRHFSFI